MIKKAIALLAALVFLCTTTLADAADKGALVLKVNNMELKGENPANGRQDTIEILSWELGVTSPRDAATGMVRGTRSYDVIKMLKPIDRTTPLLTKALADNSIVDATFKFYRTNAQGMAENYYTVTIARARIVGVKLMPAPNLDANANTSAKHTATAASPGIEEISFSFTSITFTYTNGGVSFTDTLDGKR